uniref:Uncharacterized protein n=1 Tax=Cacopsylla melanoneura TaxID=428564 RepID=A0A8D9E8Y9_9HEMI
MYSVNSCPVIRKSLPWRCQIKISFLSFFTIVHKISFLKSPLLLVLLSSISIHPSTICSSKSVEEDLPPTYSYNLFQSSISGEKLEIIKSQVLYPILTFGFNLIPVSIIYPMYLPV